MDEALRCYRHPERETYVSCTECGRGICPDCMNFGPVGIRCPTTRAPKVGRRRRSDARRATTSLSTRGPFVTQTLIAINVGVYLLQLLMGAGSARTGWIYEHGVLVSTAIDSSGQVVGVAEETGGGLVTAMFLHYGPLHLGMNMLVLWFIGPPLEDYFGHGRYALVYLVSGLAGSAGALIWSPNALTVGASGAIWGIMGAALVLEARRTYVFGGQAMGLVVINLALTFLIPGISIGGHVGGLVGGALCALAFSSFRRSLRSRPCPSPPSASSASRSPSRRSDAGSAADRDRGYARLGERRLGRGEPGERHAVGRARDVVEPEAVAERDRARLTAVLAADPELDGGLHVPPRSTAKRIRSPTPSSSSTSNGLRSRIPCSR